MTRPSWRPSRWQDFWDIRIGHLIDRLNCARGQHRVKMATYPRCITCGRVPR